MKNKYKITVKKVCPDCERVHWCNAHDAIVQEEKPVVIEHKPIKIVYKGEVSYL